jgi:hypothetical protein
MRRLRWILVFCIIWLTVPQLAMARTLTWTESPEDLVKGEADGVAVTSRGRLFLAPQLGLTAARLEPGNPLHIWSMCADHAGNIYLGTGPDGMIFKITPTGRQTLFFKTDEAMVTALGIGPEGDLLAGTTPGGKIYRIAASGEGSLWATLEERYLWSLAIDPDGTVYAGTGEAGTIYKIGSGGRARPFFTSDETHIVTLQLKPGGGLFAGGARRGLIYQIDAEGNGMVLYDDDLPEISGLLVEADGSLLATVLGPRPRREKKPTVRIRLADDTLIDGDSGSVTDLAGGTTHRYQGIIEGLPEEDQQHKTGIRGRLVRIDADGRATVLWRSSDESPFALARDAAGRTLFSTGSPAKLYRVEPRQDIALLFTLPETQATALLSTGDSIQIATSNPAALYRASQTRAESGVYLSRTFDARSPAHWGSIRWTLDSGEADAEIYTRTGNSRQPDETWSAWSPALTNNAGSKVINPDGRFLQWRARFSGAASSTTRLSGVSVRYRTLNRAPVLREFFLEAPTRMVSDKAIFRWTHYDPDGDPVNLQVEYRPIGSTAWLAVSHPDKADETLPEWSDNRLAWPTQQLAEGDYEIRAVASDQAANPPGEGRRAMSASTLIVTIDRTPPAIDLGTLSETTFEAHVTDDRSDIETLELTRHGRTQYSLHPVDGLCDSSDERFTFELAEILTEDGWSIKGVDSAGNSTELPLGQLAEE